MNTSIAYQWDIVKFYLKFSVWDLSHDRHSVPEANVCSVEPRIWASNPLGALGAELDKPENVCYTGV